MTLPTSITENQSAHLAAHEAIHAVVNRAIDAPARVNKFALDGGGSITQRPVAPPEGTYWWTEVTATLDRYGSMGWQDLNLDPPAYDFASFPTATNGRVIRRTDGSRGLWMGSQSGEWFSLSGEVVNVKEFGAIGDNVADDTTAIQFVVNMFPGQIILIPRGNYKTTDTITVSNGDVTITGPGANAATIRPSNASFNVFTLDSTATGFRLLDLTVYGAAINDTTVQYGVYTATAPSDVIIERVLFGGVDAGHGLNSGVKCDGGYDWIIHHCFFERLAGSTDGHGYGVLVGAGHRGRVHDCSFVGSVGRGRHAVYLSVGTTHWDVHDNFCQGFQESGFPLNAYSTQPANTYNKIHHNQIIDCGQNTTDSAAIEVVGNSAYNEIYNNTISNFSGNGIILTDAGRGGLCSRNVVHGNTVRYSARIGIYVYGANETTVTGNTVYNSSQGSVGTFAGIRIESWSSAPTHAADATHLESNISYGADQRCALQINPSSPVPTNTWIGRGNFWGSGSGTPSTVQLNGVSASGHLMPRIPATWAPGSVADGAAVSITRTFTDAVVGDRVLVATSPALTGAWLVSGAVTTPDSVTITLLNKTGGAFDPGTLTLTLEVWKG